ncbi:sulfotransferase 1A3-like, partial [Convolutriloba macropyga]|uniref:sulfotransferase 1A3-like n=1 Tax=Convolutriloba macropyga TaxID=536237 RepID=UPI003F51B849
MTSSEAEFVDVSNDVCVINNCYKYKGVVLEDFVDRQSIVKIGDMKVNADDTFIVSYPRTGTTWTEKILACLLEGISVASTIDVEARFPFLEFTQPEHPDCPAYDGLQLSEDQKSPRFIKSHLPPILLPDILENGAKLIFIQRDPRDCLVSHYHFYRSIVWIQYKGSVDAMLEAFACDQHTYGGYFTWYQQWGQRLQ